MYFGSCIVHNIKYQLLGSTSHVECSTAPLFLLDTRNVKAEDPHKWHRAHVAAKLGISDPDSDMVSLKLVDEETGNIAAYCQWGLSSQV
jgi:hypothetical protein